MATNAGNSLAPSRLYFILSRKEPPSANQSIPIYSSFELFHPDTFLYYHYFRLESRWGKVVLPLPGRTIVMGSVKWKNIKLNHRYRVTELTQEEVEMVLIQYQLSFASGAEQ